jgi:hypothetical protein
MADPSTTDIQGLLRHVGAIKIGGLHAIIVGDSEQRSWYR